MPLHDRDAEPDAGSHQQLPIVFLVVDTSLSMERKPGCACQTPGCEECLPDCAAGEKNAFAMILEALTGTFRVPGCTALERTAANGATYDQGLAALHHRPNVADGQHSDGLIDTYDERVDFGLGIFDGVHTYGREPSLIEAEMFDQGRSANIDGLWSFGTFADGVQRTRRDGSVVGKVWYPNSPSSYTIDVGLRSESAESGRLLFPDARSGSLNAMIQTSLLAERPFGGTPVAAAFDDLTHYIETQVTVGETDSSYVVLITEGFPDPLYREYGCSCETDTTTCGDERLSCPYPLVADAVRNLVEDGDLVEQVFVVGVEGYDPVNTELEEIATAGGTNRVRGSTSEPLIDSLSAVLDEILSR